MSTTPPLSAVEALLPYGGDYTLTPDGDIAIIQDTPDNPAATIQRVTFLIMTNPAVPYTSGIGTTSPDDIFYPNYGSGARAYVGRKNTLTNIDAVRRNILNALMSDPFIAPSPPPSVTINPGVNSSQATVTVNFTARSGQNVTIPDIPLGANVGG